MFTPIRIKSSLFVHALFPAESLAQKNKLCAPAPLYELLKLVDMFARYILCVPNSVAFAIPIVVFVDWFPSVKVIIVERLLKMYQTVFVLLSRTLTSIVNGLDEKFVCKPCAKAPAGVFAVTFGFVMSIINVKFVALNPKVLSV